MRNIIPIPSAKSLSAWFIAWMLVSLHTIHTSPATWTFAPSKVGRALHDGGWMVEYSLGQVNASPEFSFPLQLIYRNNREQQELFGRGQPIPLTYTAQYKNNQHISE